MCGVLPPIQPRLERACVAAAELLLLLLLDARHSASAPSFARTCMVSMGVAG